MHVAGMVVEDLPERVGVAGAQPGTESAIHTCSLSVERPEFRDRGHTIPQLGENLAAHEGDSVTRVPILGSSAW
ncbi:hypothetical protein Acsp02_77320 [Actinoplanes sp. NBRC 103695]|nr:hypothetical protein Acsp02_77320 [Actinoplanes sp. NBRC 103695]